MKYLSFCLLLSGITLISCEKEPEEDQVTCAFISPMSQQLLYNNTEVALTVNASGIVEKVIFYCDDEIVGTAFEEPFSVSWTPTEISGGNHEIKARVIPVQAREVTISLNVFFNYRIGETNQGGTVYYIDDTKRHGLIAAQGDIVFQSTRALYWGPDQFIGATDSIKGEANTKMLAASTYMNGYAWNVFKLGYTFNGYSDWYVPSKTELLQLLEYMKNVDNSDVQKMKNIYWSSTECCRSQAMAVDFTEKKAIKVLKSDNLFSIRPIRKF